jgi:hypothetical protein
MFLTSALEAIEMSVSETGHFTSWERALIPTRQNTGWVPDVAWMFWRRNKFTSARN